MHTHESERHENLTATGGGEDANIATYECPSYGIHAMIISVHGFRPVKLVSAKNYEIRLNNKLERPPPWMTPRTVMECKCCIGAYNPSFSQTLNALSAFLQHCDRSVSHCFQQLND